MSVFISYRRDGGIDLAGRIHDHLKNDGYDVFFDIESMRNGKFSKQIYDKIAASKDFLLILSPGALDRCVGNDDWVRLEIQRAIELEKNIVLIQMPGFVFPDQNALPEDIRAIVEYQAITPSAELFEAFIQKLESYLSSKAKGIPRKVKDAPVAIRFELYHLAIAEALSFYTKTDCPPELRGKFIGQTFPSKESVLPGFFPYLKTTIINLTNGNVAITNSSGTVDAIGLFRDVQNPAETFTGVGLGIASSDSEASFSNDKDYFRVIKEGEHISTFLCGPRLLSVFQAIHNGTFGCFQIFVNGTEYAYAIEEFPELVNYLQNVVGNDFSKLYAEDLEYRQKWI